MGLLPLLLVACATMPRSLNYGLDSAGWAAIQYQSKKMIWTLFWTGTKYYIICSEEMHEQK